MNLHPILPHSTGRNSILPHNTRRNYKLGLLSLTKYNLSLVMDFLDPQAILPSSRAKKDVVAPTSSSPPPLPKFLLLLLLPHHLSSLLSCGGAISSPSVFDPLLLSVWMFARVSFFGVWCFCLVFLSGVFWLHITTNTFLLHAQMLKKPDVQRVIKEIEKVQLPPPLPRQHVSWFANLWGPFLLFYFYYF